MSFVSKSPLTPFSKGGNIKTPLLKGDFGPPPAKRSEADEGIFLTGFHLTLTFP